MKIIKVVESLLIKVTALGRLASVARFGVEATEVYFPTARVVKDHALNNMASLGDPCKGEVILVAVDCSEASKSALLWAAENLFKEGRDLRIVYAYEPLDPVVVGMMDVSETLWCVFGLI